MNEKLFSYIEACTTPFQAIAHTAAILEDAGYTKLSEGGEWKPEEGKGYYVTRNNSSLIAFRIPKKDFVGFMMTASHCDSPSFKIKENAELAGSAFVQLSTERYGGMLMASWMDRPLSIAGRIIVRTADGIETKLVDIAEPTAIIPNLAIHMNRKANDGFTFNPAVDMLPLYGSANAKGSFRTHIAKAAGVAEEDIITTDLFVYNPQKCVEWGDFISAPRLDDLQCAFSALTAFIAAKESESVPVYCLFDNEEVGSRTKQGAASTFLRDVLSRISTACGKDSDSFRQSIANSFLLSCDNAHAVHPNHPEYADKNHSVQMNKGIVIKYNAAQNYTSDAVSAAVFQMVCDETKTPYQYYANRADLAGGGTLGNIANTQVSLNTVDIGLPQLAMHSAYETAGKDDTAYMITALTTYYGKSIRMNSDGNYSL